MSLHAVRSPLAETVVSANGCFDDKGPLACLSASDSSSPRICGRSNFISGQNMVANKGFHVIALIGSHHWICRDRDSEVRKYKRRLRPLR